MSGITRITALEIFTNPEDLEITIGQDKESGKFAIGIFRGPGHNYKPMITSIPFAETLEIAVDAIKGIFDIVLQSTKTELEDEESLTHQLLDQLIDPEKCLNQDLVDRIIADLNEHQKVSTCQMFVIPK